MATKEKQPRRTSPIGRACFVHVFEPYAAEEGKEKKYRVMLVFDKKTAASQEFKELKLACVEAAEAKFGKDARDKIKKGKLTMPWREASDYEEYGAPFSDEGAIMVSFQSREAPGIVDRRAKPITDRKDVYSGCMARVTYGVWAYDTNGNKGVTLFLNNLQKTGEGERLAGRPDAEDDFEALEGGDDGDDMDI